MALLNPALFDKLAQELKDEVYKSLYVRSLYEVPIIEDGTAYLSGREPSTKVLSFLFPETIDKIKALPFFSLPESKHHLENVLDRMLDDKCCIVITTSGQLLKLLRCHKEAIKTRKCKIIASINGQKFWDNCFIETLYRNTLCRSKWNRKIEFWMKAIQRIPKSTTVIMQFRVLHKDLVKLQSLAGRYGLRQRKIWFVFSFDDDVVGYFRHGAITAGILDWMEYDVHEFFVKRILAAILGRTLTTLPRTQAQRDWTARRGLTRA